MSPRSSFNQLRGQNKKSSNASSGHSKNLVGISPLGSIPNGMIDWNQTLLNWETKTKNTLIRKPYKSIEEKLNIYLIDNSNSMIQNGSLATAKAIALNEINRCYQQRQHFSVIEFGGNQAYISFTPQRGSWNNDFLIDSIAGGGGTHLREAVNLTNILIRNNKEYLVDVYIITDGLVIDIPPPPTGCNQIIVINMENNPPHKRIDQCLKISDAWSAKHLRFFH